MSKRENGMPTITKKMFKKEMVSEHDTKAHVNSSKGKGGMDPLIRIIEKSNLGLADISHLKSEYDKFMRVESKNFLKLLSIKDDGNRFVLEFEHFDGVPLKSFLKGKLEIKKFLEMAIQLTDALVEIHSLDLIHKRINPSNILVSKKNYEVKLAVFGLPFPLTERGFMNDKDLLSEILPYVSPEQTERMNRMVDYHTDLYSLGVVFYEMLIGETPFKSDDFLEIIHYHIAKDALSPQKRDKKIPGAVSDIIMKLLSKPAEKRYQSVYGLRKDLENCLKQLNRQGKINKFTIGSKDFSGKFSIPQKLYGRDKEIEIIMRNFDSICQGKGGMIVISGPPGIGKTALVNETEMLITKQNSYFISGKYDQYNRDMPYSAIIQAFHGLIKQLLTESEKRLEGLRTELLNAMEQNGQIIANIIPDVELIIGKQPDVPQLGPKETQNRFEMVFQKFIKFFSQKDHPLVIFMDDLQWIDQASLKLIKNILTESSAGFILLIGAYRNNEVDRSHPLMLTLDEIKKTGTILEDMLLSPLMKENINQMVADTLICDTKKSEKLASILHGKTGGNPLLVKEFLKSLNEENIFSFNPASGWQWDMKKIEIRTTVEVTEFVANKIKKMSKGTQEKLRVASCLGNLFTLETLSTVCQKTPEETFSDIESALREGLVIRSGRQYSFLHDKVREAIYSTISEREKKDMHQKIGRILLKNSDKDELAKNIAKIVTHLNYGADKLDKGDKYELARLNLMAGTKAKASTAYDSAVKYLSTGVSLLPENSWEENYELTFSLNMERAECEYLNGDFEGAEKFFDFIIEKARTKIDKAKIYNIKMIINNNRGRPDKTIELGIDGLKLFGIKMPAKPNKLNILMEFLKIRLRLLRKKAQAIYDLPEMQDPEKILLLDYITNLIEAGYFVDTNLYSVGALKSANISLKWGNGFMSPLAYEVYAFIMGSGFGNYRSGDELGLVSLKLAEKYNNLQSKSKCYFLYGDLICHWTKHAKNNIEFLEKSYYNSLQCGNYTFGGYSVICKLIILMALGRPLDAVYEDSEKYRDFMAKIKYPDAMDIFLVVRQSALALKGLTKGPVDLSDNAYDEEKHVYEIENKRVLKTPAYWYYNYKMQLLYMFEHYAEALKFMKKGERTDDVLFAHLTVAEYYFYSSLILTALYSSATRKEKGAYCKLLGRKQKRMKKWATNCPDNFMHKYLLIEAERARIFGHDKKAADLYDKAIETANESGYIQNEGIASELAGKFHLDKGSSEKAINYISRAVQCYKKWGATAKVNHIKNKYNKLLAGMPDNIPSLPVSTQHPKTEDMSVDMMSALKASQAISEEFSLERLLDKLIIIMIENAGAQRGFLLLEKNGDLFIERGIAVEGEKIEIQKHAPLDSCNYLSQSIVNYVKRTKEDVVIGDADNEKKIISDPYVLKRHPKSILCIPIIKQKTIVGVLYLENNLVKNAFTPKMLEVLKMLSSQAAISLENAKLYSEMESLVKERTSKLSNAVRELEREVAERKRVEKDLSKSKRELELKVDELEKFNKLSVGRELKMVELKKRIKNLEEKLGKESKR